MTDYKSQAKLIWSAYESVLENECVVTNTDIKALVKAIRLLTEIIVPWEQEPTEENIGPAIDYGYAWALWSKGVDIRQELINIADELNQLTTE